MNKDVWPRFATAFAIITITSFSGGCKDSQLPVVSTRPEITLPNSPDSQQGWNNLSATERLNMLSMKRYPTFPDFDRQKETTLATVQEYCKETNRTFSIKIVNSIHYANTEEFIAAVSKEEKRSYTQAEIKEIKESKIALTNSENEIYVNQDLLDKMIKDISIKNPSIVKQLEKYDLRTIYEVSALVHEFMHLYVKEMPMAFEPFPVPLASDTIIMNTLHGFRIDGKDSQGNPKYLTGGQEAMVDLAARIVAKKMGLPYYIGEYAKESDLIETLNKKAKISDEELFRNLKGESPQSGLLENWGAHRIGGFRTKSNLQNGILTLAEVALTVEGTFDFTKVEQDIRNNFSSN
jgi:hypothetical protein